MIAGISTLDSDFSIEVNKNSFDSYNMEILIDVSIAEMHAQTVTVTFGYFLYDANAITISFFEGQSLIPDNIPEGFLYGIGSIKQVGSQTPYHRLLQIYTP